MKLFRTKTFKKDMKKVKFTDKLYQIFIENIWLLLKNKTLPVSSKAHQLMGKFSMYREFHVSGDLLVIYVIEDDILKLVRIGTHSQLFN